VVVTADDRWVFTGHLSGNVSKFDLRAALARVLGFLRTGWTR
jgi:hypothetical protein